MILNPCSLQKMPKTGTSIREKVRNYVDEFPCFKADGTQLFCKVCNQGVTANQRSQVIQHVSSKKHSDGSKRKQVGEQLLISEVNDKSIQNNFGYDLCKFMTQLDIPLYKARKEEFTSFFAKYIKGNVPCETQLRTKYAPMIEETTMAKIRDTLKDQYTWVQIDETEDAQKRCVVNVVIGILSSDPELSKRRFLLHVSIQENVNGKIILRIYQEAMEKLLGYDKHRVLLFISDAAKYMLLAGRFLKGLYPKQIHVTCVAHALHRVCEKIRDRNQKADTFISNMKKVFLKATSRKSLFRETNPGIPLPPAPVTTRWGTWIEAAVYYMQYWTQIKKVLSLLNAKDAIAIEKVKQLIEDEDVEQQVIVIATNFGDIPLIIKSLQSSSAPLKDTVGKLQNVKSKFNGLPDEFQPYKDKLTYVLDNNPGLELLTKISDFLAGKSAKPQCMFTPSELAALTSAPLTSTDVERTFSMYNAFLRENRCAFTQTHLVSMFFIYCNANM